MYRRRHPERTVLYRVMQENLETWLARRGAADRWFAKKYGADWDRYRRRVPWRIVPKIY